MFLRISRAVEIILAYIIFSALFSYSTPPPSDQVEKTRAYTRNIEFDYINWTRDAVLIKLQAASVDLPYSLDREHQKQVVTEYLALTQSLLDNEYALEKIFADAGISDKKSASTDLRASLDKFRSRQHDLAPLAEAVLQEQVATLLAEIGLTSLGQPIPMVLYHATPLPFALIVSPRKKIEQLANVSLNTNLSIDEQDELESRIDRGLNSSSLVVPIGGVGVYPTMVMQSTNLSWLLDTISHEWIHNYLTFRPLGISYLETPELRTMNETTASIAGNEIGMLVMDRFYPEYVNVSTPNPNLISNRFGHPEPGDSLRPRFDFRAEMHITRVTTDAMLAAGRIEDAEAYMEARRLVFLQNGFLIRKLNQAYFAFYGAYADVPGGAAGEDPVGPAVRALRAQSDSLADFVNTISWMTNFKQLQKAVKP